MSYPLRTENYLRPPFCGATTENNNIPDVYNDANHEDEGKYADSDDDTACGVGQIPDEAELTKPEPTEVLASSFASLGFDAPRVTAPPSSASGLPIWIDTPDNRVVQEGDRRWTATIEVDPKLHGILIGQQFQTKNEMQTATQCNITFPPKNSNSPLIRIVSSVGQENVARCLDRIEAIVESRTKDRNKHYKTTTHFAAIPCNDPWVRQRFLTFKDLMLTSKDVDPSCMVESLFPPKMKLHLTICMLQLQTDEEKDLAMKAMTVLKEKYAERPPLVVHIDGFEITNNDPTNVHVLFAKIHGDGVQELVDEIRDELAKAGLISKISKEDREKVNLHMTVMNSRYATVDETGNLKRDYKDRKPFDVSWIMREHGDWPFGAFTLNRLTICTIQTEDEKGYYECFFDETLKKTC